jgi:hypothetical protein
MRRPLPKAEWVKAEDVSGDSGPAAAAADTTCATLTLSPGRPLPRPLVEEVAREDAERATWDTIEVVRK